MLFLGDKNAGKVEVLLLSFAESNRKITEFRGKGKNTLKNPTKIKQTKKWGKLLICINQI